MVTEHPARTEEPQRRSAAPRLLWWCLGALVAGFGLSAALTAPLAAESHLGVGEWGSIAVFAAVGVPLAVIDGRTRRLPNAGTFPLAAALLGYWTGLATTTGQWQLLAQAVTTAAVIFAVAAAIALIGTLAAGDIKLFLAIGLLAGWFSWMLPLYALVAGYILAIPHAGILLARRRRAPGADTRLPFGPYLVAAALLVTIAAKLAG
ncbi:prepilin peptidase [Microbacterium sp. CCH5-D1]|jgi:leader peptidase (prepilin peptidase)/N-methyltransferase|uniref:prepilin peptidase n=1 Tax=Microbacterium sp. CCH5-D1 TaxID=1768780 RepID=UPI00076A4419|nr:prepilin peptidase [Microbacterium sp. CCH5-D1]